MTGGSWNERSINQKTKTTPFRVVFVYAEKTNPNLIRELIPFPEFPLELTNPSLQIINLVFKLQGIMPLRLKFTNEPTIDDDFLLAFVNAWDQTFNVIFYVKHSGEVLVSNFLWTLLIKINKINNSKQPFYYDLYYLSHWSESFMLFHWISDN